MLNDASCFKQVYIVTGYTDLRSEIDQLFLSKQDQFESIDSKLQLVFSMKRKPLRQSRKYDENELVKQRSPKVKGKRSLVLADLLNVEISHKMTEEELIWEFGDNGWYQLKDEIYNRYRFTPAKIEIKEHHAGRYRSKKDNHFKKADHPAYLIRNSLVSTSLLAGILNEKHVNAVPLYRQEQEFARYGLEISRRETAYWTILCTERYLSLIYDCMHKKLYEYHVLQADETPVRVTKENGTEGSKHFIWVYRTRKMYEDRPSILYDYQPSRNLSHQKKFLKDFRGICVTDGYQVYHTLEEEREDLTIAGCWAHSRCYSHETLKVLAKAKRNDLLACLALKQIQVIYREEKKFAEESAVKRLKHRWVIITPMVDAYFA